MLGAATVSVSGYHRSAAAFDNPDHVAITIHNYRWRQGLAEGEAKYEDLEKRLAAAPTIGVPVKGFGCRPRSDGAANSGGRRPKASKGGNRGKGYVGGATRYNGALAAAFGHPRGHNFNDLARVLLNTLA